MQARKKVLVVDDDKAVADVFQKILEAYGYEVNCSESGRSALRLAEQHCFDAVLADYYLPELNGAELSRSLRELCPRIVIVGMSGRSSGEEFRDIAGAFFLRKPILSTELVSVLNRSFGALPGSSH